MEKRSVKIRESLKSAQYFFIGVFAFVVIAISIMLMIYIPSVTSLIDEHTKAEIGNAAMANSSAAETYFNGKEAMLQSIAPDFTEIDLNDDDAVLEVCRKAADGNGFRHVGFTRVDGVTISSTGNKTNTSNRAFIKRALEGRNSLFARVPCDFDGELSDMYTIVVRNTKGEILGALTGDCVPFMFSDITLIDVAGDASCFFIFDVEGDVVYCSDGNKAGIGASDNILNLIDDNKTSKDIEYLLNSISRDDYKKLTIHGKKYLAAFSGISGKDWTFAAIIPVGSAQASFSTLIVITLVILMLMSLLLLTSILVVTLRINRVNREIDGAISESLQAIYVDSITGHDTIEKFRENYTVSMKDTATGHALISLDVDRFKAVNDMFGFEGGNEIIRTISGIIKRNIGKHDFFARGGGDLFYIFAEFTDRKELAEIAENIMSDVDYQITEVKLNISIGIYIIDDPNIRSRVAADRADMARDSVKNSKQSRFSFFDNSMLAKIRREKKIEDIMEDSLALGEFLVYLQPKFCLGEHNDVVGAEALVRWRHDGKIIPPGDFIPLFERNGFVMKLDYYMFEEVCKLQKKYISLGLVPKVISVNMSRVHIHKPGFVDELAAICEKYDVDTKYLEIEITESAAYEDAAALNDIFREIKQHGFHVSIDDFGTGYSSLNMLKDLPVDVLKIDRSFLTENADEHENASLIIGCVVSLAASLSIRTICEGIETKEQAVLLTKLGCNMAQGFFFAKPMPVADYEKLAYNIKS
ncbi:MAG: EAL domain-containing protein [Ruminiclostridium sp.]|nr:EAL domain-containing protein [Ruminiclostridium sp.]